MKESKNTEAALNFYHKKKLNVIPFDTKNKKPIIPSYTQYQNQRIPEVVFNDWIEKGLFEKGMAIFPGKIYLNDNKGEELYWVSIDLDSQTAINEFCSIFGENVRKQYVNAFLTNIDLFGFRCL